MSATTVHAPPRSRRGDPDVAGLSTWLRDNQRWLLWLLSGIVFIGGWELYSRSGRVSPLFLPPPSQVVATLLQLTGRDEFYRDVAITSKEFGLGFGLSVLVGIPLGLAVGWYRRLSYALNPFLTSLYALPRVALLPWILLLLGLDLAPKVAMVFLGAVLPITISTQHGVRTVDASLLRVARSFGASQLFIFRTLVLPGVVPFTITGARIGVGTGLIGAIIAEFLTARNGIGYMMHVAGHNLETDLVFVGILVIALGALLLMTVLTRIESYFQRWRPR